MKLFDLYATLGLDASGFNKGVSSAQRTVSSFASGIGRSMGGVGSTVSGVVGSVIRAAGSMENAVATSVTRAGTAFTGLMGTLTVTGVKYNSMMENYTMDFTTLLQNAEKAEAKVEELRSLDLSTPLDFETLASATKMMLNFGIAEEEAGEKLTQLSDIAMGNKEKFDSLTLAFSQIRSVGKLTMMDLRQMANQGFNPLQIVAEETGVAIGDLQDYMSYGKPSEAMTQAFRQAQEEVKKLGENASDGAKMLAQMANEGIISADIVARSIDIATGEGGRFYKATENAAKTLTGQWSMLQGGTKKLIGNGFQPLSESLTEDILPNLNEFVDRLDAAYNTQGGGNSGLVSMLAVTRDELYKIRDYSEEIGENLGSSIRKGMRTGSLGIKTFNAILPDMLAIGRDAFSAFRTGFKDNVSQLANSAEIIAPDVLAGAIGIKGDFLVAGLDIVGGIAEGISSDFGAGGENRILNTLTGAMVNVFESLGDNAEIIGTGAGNIVSGLADWFTSGENADALLGAGFDAVTAIGSAIISNADEILIAGAEIANKLVGSLPGHIAKMGGTWGEQIGLSIASLALPGEYETVEDLETALGIQHNSGYDWLIYRTNQELSQIDDAEDLLNYVDQKNSEIEQNGGILSSLGKLSEYTEGMDALKNGTAGALEEVESMKKSLDDLDGTTANTYLNTHYKSYFYDSAYYGTGAASTMTSGGKKVDDSHYIAGFDTGLDFVPFDNFMARLHEGEAVLTKAEAENWRKDRNSTVTRSEFYALVDAIDNLASRDVVMYADNDKLAEASYRKTQRMLDRHNHETIIALGG